MATKEEMKKEAVKRMKAYGIGNDIIQRFINTGDICYSKESDPGEIYYPDDEYKQAINDFEKEMNVLVYHAIEQDIAKMKVFLYVTACKEEWEYDAEDIMNRSACAYVVNMAQPEFSEFGSVGIKVVDGMLQRTW